MQHLTLAGPCIII